MKFSTFSLKILSYACFCTFLSCANRLNTGYTPFTKLAPEKLRQDVDLLKKIVETYHPSLYWYTPKDSIDFYFNTISNSITDSITEISFKNKIAWLVEKIKCGHTAVSFSKRFNKIAAKYQYPQFPLALKVWDDSAVVIASRYRNDAVFKRGTIVHSINGQPIKALLDSFHQFISSDGYSVNYKNVVLSSNFPGWYKTVFGVDSLFKIVYYDSTKTLQHTTIRAFTPVKDTSQKTAQTPAITSRKLTRKEKLTAKRYLQVDTVNASAYMRLNTFSPAALKKFFRQSFKTIEQYKIQHLIIDLRENGGGRVVNQLRLTKYLATKPFKIGDTVAAISRSAKYSRYIKPNIIRWLSTNFEAKKMEDGRFHYRRYETKLYQPNSNKHFNGAVYLIQGGRSFSAATMFISSLQHQSNVIVVGEETGGGYYGNSAMHIPTITLPYSELQITLPAYRLVIDSKRPKGRGILPDVYIPPNSAAIQHNQDPKLLWIEKDIKTKKARQQ